MKRLLITEDDKRHILSLYNLVEDFKSQKKKFIEQGNDEEIVDKYLADFREIKDKKFKELEKADLEGLNVEKGPGRYDIDRYKTFKELELVVDFMAGQRKFGSANFEDIKVDGKPIFEDDVVEIYYAPNKQSCVEYKGNKPYSWCIARSDSSNMFMRYRTNQNRPSFYFVKRKNATNQEFEYWNTSGKDFTGTFRDKYHFFVVQTLKDGSYIVTSAMNDGDRKMTWDDILEIAPELSGKQDYFQSKPLGDKEIEKYEKYKKGLSDEEFIKLPYIEKEYYIDTAVDKKNKLTDKQFSSLPDDLKNKYINLGLELTHTQLEIIKNNKKLLNRYKEMVNETFYEKHTKWGIRNFILTVFELNHNEYELLNDVNKEFFDISYSKGINNYVDKMINQLDAYDDDYLPIVGEYISKVKKYGDVETSYNPDLFFFKKYAPKEKIINSANYIKYLLFWSLLKSEETMVDLMQHLGVDYKKLINSFNGEEMEFYNELK
jgi:hypothetical protein